MKTLTKQFFAPASLLSLLACASATLFAGCAGPELEAGADDDDDDQSSMQDEDSDATSENSESEGSASASEESTAENTDEDETDGSDDSEVDGSDETSSAEESSTEGEESTTADEESSQDGESSSTADESGDSSADTSDDDDDSGDPECQNIEPSGGVDPGDILHDVSAPDQNGNTHTVHQHCKEGIAIVISTEWCAPCNEEAPVLQEKYERYKDKGVVFMTFLVQSDDGSPADAATAMRWATKHKLTHPVLAPVQAEVTDYWTDFMYYPSYKLLKSGIVVAGPDPFVIMDADIDGIVP
jgi:thiol-disulfide isomerase/thioredoxin